MDGELRTKYNEVSTLKNIILENKNIDILLFLAKYNPRVTKSKIISIFGKKASKGLKDLERVELIREDSNRITLTNEGIFQLEGLISMVP